jgi:glycosyltransferase involved in cell wall biosynthesis
MISIVMSYFNRLPLLDFTLSTIAKSRIKDIEVIVVDDFSDEEHTVTPNIFHKHGLDRFQIITMSKIKSQKDYVNPCIPYNIGLRQASGKKIIIQNPECCHIGDVINYVNENLTDDNYLSFSCYAATFEDNARLHQGLEIEFNNVGTGTSDIGNWYNHKVYRPAGYHFLSAITKYNLRKLNGFDETFANGFAFDDDEFLQRVKNLKLNLKFVENPFVIHQWHGLLINKNSPQPAFKNKKLFGKLLKNPIVRANNEEDI